MIGVCINYFHTNYGGMLQAYATVNALEAEGVSYELIRYEKKRSTAEKIRSLPRLLNGVLLNDKYEALLKKIGEKRFPEFARNNAVRRAAFQAFQEGKFQNFSPVMVGYQNLCEGAKRYDAVLTGSDQLWSPAGLPTNFYNLMFVPENIRKISFASSFGVSNIPWYQKKRTREYLERIEYVSMRENRGGQIVKELTGRDVPVIMDPVFYFDRLQWQELVLPAPAEWEPYVFCYFLGDNPEYRKAVTALARSRGLKIVTLRHLDRYVATDEKFGDYAPYEVSPDRFLNILRNAAFVCTDSFHGTAFSVINQKEFAVFNRYQENASNSKNSRIDSLCENLGLEDRRYAGFDSLHRMAEQKIDYPAVNDKVSQYRKRMKEYLASALK